MSPSKNRYLVKWNRESALRRKIKRLEKFVHNLKILKAIIGTEDVSGDRG